MGRNITLSPEALPYWNYIKSASPKVKEELAYFLVHVNAPEKETEKDENEEDEIEDRLVFPKTREDELEILRRAFRDAKLLKEGKLKTRDFWEVINEL